jgi:hypothetical protein
MQIDSFDIFLNLIIVQSGHNIIVIFQNFIVLCQKTLDVSIKLMTFVEKSLYHLNPQTFTYLQYLLVFSYHFP